MRTLSAESTDVGFFSFCIERKRDFLPSSWLSCLGVQRADGVISYDFFVIFTGGNESESSGGLLTYRAGSELLT